MLRVGNFVGAAAFSGALVVGSGAGLWSANAHAQFYGNSDGRQARMERQTREASASQGVYDAMTSNAYDLGFAAGQTQGNDVGMLRSKLNAYDRGYQDYLDWRTNAPLEGGVEFQMYVDGEDVREVDAANAATSQPTTQPGAANGSTGGARPFAAASGLSSISRTPQLWGGELLSRLMETLATPTASFLRYGGGYGGDSYDSGENVAYPKEQIYLEFASQNAYTLAKSRKMRELYRQGYYAGFALKCRETIQANEDLDYERGRTKSQFDLERNPIRLMNVEVEEKETKRAYEAGDVVEFRLQLANLGNTAVRADDVTIELASGDTTISIVDVTREALPGDVAPRTSADLRNSFAVRVQNSSSTQNFVPLFLKVRHQGRRVSSRYIGLPRKVIKAAE